MKEQTGWISEAEEHESIELTGKIFTIEVLLKRDFYCSEKHA